MNRHLPGRRLALPGCLVLCLALPAYAQIPDTFTNLRVLPVDITRPELMDAMKGFSAALGVRCVHCHVGDDAKGFASFDFASDDKEPKRAARVMMEMVQHINEVQLARLDDPADERLRVQCVTCHRGQEEPRLIEDVLTTRYAAGGADSVVALYRELRARYFGSHTFDFSERMLLEVGERLARQGDPAAALELTDLNLEFYPESAFSYFQRGVLQTRLEDPEGARTSLERALELDPELRPARRMLQRMQEGKP